MNKHYDLDDPEEFDGIEESEHDYDELWKCSRFSMQVAWTIILISFTLKRPTLSPANE